MITRTPSTASRLVLYIIFQNIFKPFKVLFSEEGMNVSVHRTVHLELKHISGLM